jgi:hypothetical protein
LVHTDNRDWTKALHIIAEVVDVLELVEGVHKEMAARGKGLGAALVHAEANLTLVDKNVA